MGHSGRIPWSKFAKRFVVTYIDKLSYCDYVVLAVDASGGTAKEID